MIWMSIQGSVPIYYDNGHKTLKGPFFNLMGFELMPIYFRIYKELLYILSRNITTYVNKQ